MENIWRIMEKCIVLLCLLHCCYGVIYKLNESEYKRMPPKYETDSFVDCRSDPDGVYCFGEYDLVSDTPSPLLDMIREYSEHNTTHFNHTKIFRGICATGTCTKFNKTGLALETVLGACLNESLYNKYQLKARLRDRWSCNQPPKSMQPDDLDIAVAAICGVILLVNLIGSLYEPIFGERTDSVTKFLLCFSIRKNWRKLTAPIAEHQDPRLQSLKSITGIRSISIILVIMAHSVIACVVFIENPEFVEQMYHFHTMKILFNGIIIMQTFLVMSGFLLVYNTLLQAEKRNITWGMFPKLLGLRYLRLTPAYAVVLALQVSWFKFLTNGPLWQYLVNEEVEDCRENWWLNLLYVNNYNDKSQCMQHTWYLAADTQLYCFGIVLYLLLKSSRSRKIFLPIVIAVGAIIPGIITYYMNLDGTVIASPESIHGIFMNEPTFNNTYRRGHTNMTGYTMGVSLAYIVYHYQKKGIDVYRLRKYRYLVPMMVPIAMALVYSCSFFFEDRPRAELWIRAVSASLLKPTFAFMLAIFLFTLIFKIDDVCRCIVEWSGWTVPSRLSYCAYLFHVAFIRNYVAFQTTIFRTDLDVMNQVFVRMVLASFCAALPLWLMVEAPVGNLMREFITKPNKFKEKADSEGKQNGIHEENHKTKIQ